MITPDDYATRLAKLREEIRNAERCLVAGPGHPCIRVSEDDAYFLLGLIDGLATVAGHTGTQLVDAWQREADLKTRIEDLLQKGYGGRGL